MSYSTKKLSVCDFTVIDGSNFYKPILRLEQSLMAIQLTKPQNCLFFDNYNICIAMITFEYILFNKILFSGNIYLLLGNMRNYATSELDATM